MSYQITSTPFFRRMFNTSKKNGQLQRLREEYERIQEFNDRTIELKMRQVRLKRLFREIEEIKESQAMPQPRRHRSSGGGGTSGGIGVVGGVSLRPVGKTPQMQRIEALARAKELGQELSRRNAELAEQGVKMLPRSDLRMTTKRRAAAEYRRQASEKRERTAKRINYGNEQSKSNMQKIVQRRHNQSRSRGSAPGSNAQVERMETTSLVDNEKRSRLQHRLDYGNSRSNSNMEKRNTTVSSLARGMPHINLLSTNSNIIEPAPMTTDSSHTTKFRDAYDDEDDDDDDNTNVKDMTAEEAAVEEERLLQALKLNDENDINEENEVIYDLDAEQQRVLDLLVDLKAEPQVNVNRDDEMNKDNAENKFRNEGETGIDQSIGNASKGPTTTPESEDNSSKSHELTRKETIIIRKMTPADRLSENLFDEISRQRAQDRWHLVSLTLPWFNALPVRTSSQKNVYGGTDGSSYEDAQSATGRSSEKRVADRNKRRTPKPPPIPMHEVLFDAYNSFARGTQKYHNDNVRRLRTIFEH